MIGVVVFLSAELYYLIARFLQSGPCQKSAQVRRKMACECRCVAVIVCYGVCVTLCVFVDAAAGDARI